jgi:uncharacterized protein (DUF305 family)
MLAAVCAAAAALTLTACSSNDHTAAGGSHSTSTSPNPADSSSSAQPAADRNPADVTFATGMIPHHGQAIIMADMAVKQASNSQVKRLGVEIKAAQGPEITTLSGWLKAWGAPVPSASMSAGHDMGGHEGMTGMMSAAELQQLEGASGAAFDKLWLEMMITHHQGAIEMAKTELATGQNQPAKALAQSIITSQAKEIATMQALLSSLS